MATTPGGRVGRPGAVAVAVTSTAPGWQAAAGLVGIGGSIALTFTVAVLGPSVMEPPLPGHAGQPPWAFTAHPSPYLVVGLTAVAILSGAAGLALTLAVNGRGWRVPPGWVLVAGVCAAVALALVPPFGSSDHLSYAAYGRMALTGHDPYTTTPAALARLGDPVARAVQDWRNSPSVYGALATGGQALASLAGGTSVRLTVFVLSLFNVAAFAVTGLLLHWLAGGDRGRQLRCALLWTCNPLLLQVLVAGAHVDSQAIMFGIAAVAVCAAGVGRARTRSPARLAPVGAAAGALVGLGFAVKATIVLVGAGLAVGCLLAWRGGPPARLAGAPAEGPGRAADSGRAGGSGLAEGAGLAGGSGRAGPLALLAGLAAGFAVTAGGSLLAWGPGSLAPALRAGSYVSIASPWRAVRSALHLVLPLRPAEDLVKAGAVVLALALLWLLLRSIGRAGPDRWPAALTPTPGPLARPGPAPSAWFSGWALAAVFAVAFAWLLAWPYVLPWYDGLGWALLALLPASRLDWLMLIRTTALAVGYLPARGIVMPGGLRWLETVVRTAVTPVLLLGVIVALAVLLRRGWSPGHRIDEIPDAGRQ